MFEKEIKKFKEILKISKDCNNNELYWIEFKTNFSDEESMYEVLGKNI